LNRCKLESALEELELRKIAKQNSLGAEAFRVSTSFSVSSEVHSRSESDVDSLSVELCAHSDSSLLHQISIEGRRNRHPGGESRNEIRNSNSNGSV